MSKTVKIEHEVAAPPERTFEIFTDFEHMAERVSGIQSLEVLTSGPVGKGTRFRETRVMFGKEATEEMEITAFEPGKSYTTEARSHGAHYVSVLDFVPAAGGTRVVMTFTAHPETFGAKVMTALMGWMMSSAAKKCMAKDFADLGKFAESQAGAAAS